MAAREDVDYSDTDMLYEAAKQAVQDKRPQLNVCSETQIKQWYNKTFANLKRAP
jgi:hypothetical protein